MLKSLRAGILGCAILSMTLSSVVVRADDTTQSTPVPDKASNFVHCDGKPNKESSLGMAARLVAISLVVGLFIPMPETPDATKRMNGEDGIKACDAALNGQEKAKDGGRRLELILGRAVHRMEVADWQGAIDDIHTLPNDQPEMTSTRAYRQSLAQTAAYLAGISLVGKDDVNGAVAMGYKIANESPYDAYSIQLAGRLILLQDGYTPEKKQFLDQLVRINPGQIVTRASARADAGDFTGAGDDYAAFGNLLGSMPDAPNYLYTGLAAIGYRLAGNAQQADDLIAAAKAKADADTADGKHADLVSAYTEISDFYAIIVALDNAQGARARTMFSAHSHWTMVNYGYVEEMAKRLQSAGTPDDQAASPIQTPNQVVADYKKARIAAIMTKGEKGDQYWKYFIPANSEAAYDKLASSVWKTSHSPFLAKTKDKDWNAQYVDTSSYGVGIPCGYAMYMHLAVMAKAQGKSGFMIMPGQDHLCSAFARIGNPDDKDMVPAFTMNADQVIADLGSYFPKPAN